jgi:hypothetical protein
MPEPLGTRRFSPHPHPLPIPRASSTSRRTPGSTLPRSRSPPIRVTTQVWDRATRGSSAAGPREPPDDGHRDSQHRNADRDTDNRSSPPLYFAGSDLADQDRSSCGRRAAERGEERGRSAGIQPGKLLPERVHFAVPHWRGCPFESFFERGEVFFDRLWLMRRSGSEHASTLRSPTGGAHPCYYGYKHLRSSEGTSRQRRDTPQYLAELSHESKRSRRR